MALTNGVYSLCAFDNYTMLADNSSGSKSANNPQILFSYTGGANQKFKISNAESSKTNEKKITNQDSGQSWYINKHATLLNQSVCQFPDGSGAYSDERSWEMLEDGRSVTINGNSYNTYNINCGADTSYSVDYTDAIKASTNPLKLKASDSTSTKQSFVPMKTTYYNQSLIAPTIYFSGEKNNIIDCDRDVIYNAELFLNNGSKYQVRLKRSYLLHDTNTWEEDPLYYSPTDLTTDYGWGDVWNNNATSWNLIQMRSATSSPVGRQPYDCVKYEIEARQYTGNSSAPWSGVSNWKTYTTRQRVIPTVEGAKISATGLVIDLRTDAFRTIDTGNATIDVLYDGKSILQNKMSMELNIANPAFVIPYETITKMPQLGDEITVNVTLKTNSQYVSGFTISSGAIVDIQGGDLEPVIGITKVSNCNVNVTISEATSKDFNYVDLSMIYIHDGAAIVKKLIDGEDIKETKFTCPLNIEFTLFCLIAKKNSSGTIENWGTEYINHTLKNNVDILVLNSKSAEVEFTYCVGTNPSDCISKSKELSSEEVSLNGNKYQDVYFSGSQPIKYSIKGLYLLHKDRDVIDAVLNDCYVLLRTTWGEYANCAIKNINYEKFFTDGASISIDMIETTHHEDIALPE